MKLRTTCPYCGTKNDMTDHVGDSDFERENESVSLCWGCGNLAVFTSGPLGIGLRVATVAEQESMAKDPFIIKALAVFREAKAAGMPAPEAIAALRDSREQD